MRDTATTTDRLTSKAASRPVRLHEDWTAVVLGGTVLALVLLGLVPALPGLRWADAASAARLFSPGVLGGWIAAGIGVGAMAAVGLAL